MISHPKGCLSVENSTVCYSGISPGVGSNSLVLNLAVLGAAWEASVADLEAEAVAAELQEVQEREETYSHSDFHNAVLDTAAAASGAASSSHTDCRSTRKALEAPLYVAASGLWRYNSPCLPLQP
eukprot:gb/GECG01007795.1/.p1 GENE.gb/GECG01007795.1/~~gb/GECG01007795.1/.p1  ORF type:complete len:125 (+),score=8.79 gb/GECG01007795.1/:1-375(+)